MGVPQQVLEEGVDVHNLARGRIQEQNAVLRGLKETAVAQLGYRQGGFHPAVLSEFLQRVVGHRCAFHTTYYS